MSTPAKRGKRGGKKKKKKKSAPITVSSGAPQLRSIWRELGGELIRGLPEIISAIGAFPTSNMSTLVMPSNGSMKQTMTATAPIANGAMVRTTVPKVVNRVNGVRVTHREFISNVIAPANSASDNLFSMAFMGRINPGNARVFPWLATIAQRFESYLFRSLRFIYEMQCSTTQSGTVMIVIDYDTVDPPPSSKEQMMAYVGATRSPPWFACAFNAAPGDLRKSKTYYVTTTEENPANTDAKTYFVGNVYCATETGNLSESVSFGELYVEYDVDLLTPVLDASTGSQFYAGGTLIGGGEPVVGVWSAGSLNVTYDPANLFNSPFYVEGAGLYNYRAYVWSPTTTVGVLGFDFTINSPNEFANTLTNTGVSPSYEMNLGAATSAPPTYAVYTGYFNVSSPPGILGVTITGSSDMDTYVLIVISSEDPAIATFLGIVPTSFNAARNLLYQRKYKIIPKSHRIEEKLPNEVKPILANKPMTRTIVPKQIK